MMNVLVSDYPIRALKVDLSTCGDLRYAVKEAHRTVRGIPGNKVEIQFDWHGIEVTVKKDSDLGWLIITIENASHGDKVGPYPVGVSA